jgi:hypothetical protein
VVPAAEGGETTAENGQSLCEACNYAKEAPGWSARTVAGLGAHTVVTTTPTGHSYTSRAPCPPGLDLSLAERRLRRAINIAYAA